MTEVVKYDQFVEFLKQASLHDLYRLSAAIQNEMTSHERIKAIRQKFKVNDIVEYFDGQTNTYIKAKVLDKKLKNVSVVNCGDGQQWRLPYYLLKIDAREFDFSAKKSGLDKNAIKVGDWVGFNHDGREIVGQVQRLNQKTVSLLTKDRHRWRVSYRSLYSIIDSRECRSLNLDLG